MERSSSRSSVQDPALAEESVLCDFMLMVRADESAGRARALSEYLARFPALELPVAREYLARIDRALADAGQAPTFEPRRYRLGAVIGRGGMGEVRRIHDGRLDRDLAMKTLLRPGEGARRRFLREASITGRLDHPGVVPVLDIGEDEDGRPFFTMRHVEGIDLDQVIERLRGHAPEWTLPRVLEVLIKVCETMAFAHSRGIVHRDLKPSNIRVGRFGEVFVMDWGLSRVLAGTHDSDGPEPIEGELAPGAHEGGTLTLDGDVLGTPAYMAPEQAHGDTAALDRTADVHAVGAILYHVLSGRRPYDSGERKGGPGALVELVRTRAPARLEAPGMPRELVAICEKAMARRPADRYPRMEALVGDLRAFLDRRLVSAYRTGPLERLVKWARRNPAASIALVSVTLVLAVAAALVHQGRREGRQRLLQLSRSPLVAAFDTLWPPQAANRAALELWLTQAEEVLATRSEDLLALEQLKGRALPMDPDAPAERAEAETRAGRIRQLESLILHYDEWRAGLERGERAPPEGLPPEWVAAQVQVNREQLARERELAPRHLTFRFGNEDDQVLFEALTLLTAEQEKLLGPLRPLGLIELARWGVAACARVEEPSGQAALDWEAARRSVADRDECPSYAGLELVPQRGLVPLGRDPRSGLWEFAHVLSGPVPRRAVDGTLILGEDSAIVLVLVPGGALRRGSQREDPAGPNFDPWAEAGAPAPDEISLEPFFLSKFELTQAQWKAVSGRNPSLHVEDSLAHPLENVDHAEARRFLRVLGLTLPTEAQWEWAQRAGTDTPWSCGSTPESLAGHANTVGERIVRGEFWYANAGEVPAFDDGFATHAPVGSFRPNGFGLHDMMGNVREWCLDAGPFDYRYGFTRIGTGERLHRDEGTRAARGGSFSLPVLACRSAERDQVGPLTRAGDLGLRAAREIER